MKEFLLNMMLAMMPAMYTIMYIGAGCAVLAVILYLLAKKTGYKAPLWAARIALAVGLFFLLAHPMGLFLGFPPSLNFADAAKYEFNLKPFWLIGVVILIPAWIIWSFASNKLKAQK